MSEAVAISGSERIAELATFADNAWSGWTGVGWEAANTGEKSGNFGKTGIIRLESFIDCGKITIIEEVSLESWKTMTRAEYKDCIIFLISKNVSYTSVDEINARTGAPVPEEPRFDVVER